MVTFSLKHINATTNAGRFEEQKNAIKLALGDTLLHE